MKSINIERILFLFYYYKISIVVAILFSAFTLTVVISKSFNPNYNFFTLAPIPLIALTIMGYLVTVIKAKSEIVQIIYTVILIGLCLVSLCYLPFINAFGEETLEMLKPTLFE